LPQSVCSGELKTVNGSILRQSDEPRTAQRSGWTATEEVPDTVNAHTKHTKKRDKNELVTSPAQRGKVAVSAAGGGGSERATRASTRGRLAHGAVNHLPLEVNPLSRMRVKPCMRRSQKIRSAKARAEMSATLAKSLAPEEILPGDYVALLHVACELPSFLWCAEASTLPLQEPVRIRFVPEGGGIPLKVRAVCLPFVLVKVPQGGRTTLDVRHNQFARLDRTYAVKAWKAHKAAFKKARKRRDLAGAN
jgi:hypothetical protein